MIPRLCACGTILPPDKRVKRCAACAGAGIRAADNTRHARRRDKHAAIDWPLVGIAVRMKLEEIRANDKRVQALVEEIAASQVNAPASVVPYAARGRVLRPENFRRVLAWLGRPAEDFEKRPERETARQRFA